MAYLMVWKRKKEIYSSRETDIMNSEVSEVSFFVDNPVFLFETNFVNFFISYFICLHDKILNGKLFFG